MDGRLETANDEGVAGSAYDHIDPGEVIAIGGRTGEEELNAAAQIVQGRDIGAADVTPDLWMVEGIEEVVRVVEADRGVGQVIALPGGQGCLVAGRSSAFGVIAPDVSKSAMAVLAGHRTATITPTMMAIAPAITSMA